MLSEQWTSEIHAHRGSRSPRFQAQGVRPRRSDVEGHEFETAPPRIQTGIDLEFPAMDGCCASASMWLFL